MYDFDQRPTLQAIAVRVRHLRREAQLSQSELARRAHVSTETVNRLEKQKESPTLSTLMCIASALGVPLAVLVDGTPVVQARPKVPTDREARQLAELLPQLEVAELRILLRLARFLCGPNRRRLRSPGGKGNSKNKGRQRSAPRS